MDNTMDDIKKFCPNCSQLYFLSLTSSKLKGNLPLFLSCGHTMCEKCIVNILKCLEPIECKVCLRDIDLQSINPTELLQDKCKLYQKFPVNGQMVGELTVNLMTSNSTQNKTEEESFIDLKALIKSDSAQGNCLECSMVTTKMCKECVTILCDACFHKTHKNFVIFKNHVLQAIESAAQPMNCKLHLGKPLDYYCKDCEKSVCTDCMMLGGEKSCKNHDVVSLQEVNATFLEDLTELSPKVDETLRRLTKTAVINIPALLEEAKQIENTPWYLNRKEANSESLKVTVNEDLCSLISDYVHLEGNVKSVYKLYATSEIGDDVEIPPAPTSIVYPPELPKDARQSSQQKIKRDPQPVYTSAPKYRSKSGSVSSLNSNCSENSTRSYLTQNSYLQQPVVQPVAPFQENLRPQQLSEGSQELIYISHIVDPHNFFVQRACFQGLIKDMVREFRNAVSFVKPSVNHITPGKTYLAFNKADNMWQRCRVLAVDTKNNKPIVQVFCYDFGSIEFVSADRLRILPPSNIQCSYPLAINCSLANCLPKTGAWTSEDSFLIQNIIDNKQAVIYIRRIIPLSNGDFQLECDVTTFENGISLAHALVFHDRAKMQQPNLAYPPIMGVKEKPKLFTSHNEFRNDTPELVTITHVISPDKFYVRKQHLQEVYEKLTEDLEQEYSLASKVGTVYLPEKGMVCAVNLENCKNSVPETTWARGVVSELPGRGRVRLALPDSGHDVLVHWTALRYIRPNFTKLSALATECYLAGITPLNKKWNAAAVDLLQKYTENVLELRVEDNRNKASRNRGSLGVTLYDNTNDENVVCINNEMIKYKFAVSFGVYGFNQNPVEEQVRTNKSPLAKPKPLAPKTSQVTILKKPMPNKKVNEADLEAKDKGPLRLEVKILNYQSPSLIYVSLVHQQKTFNELFEKIQKFYSKNKGKSREEWKYPPIMGVKEKPKLFTSHNEFRNDTPELVTITHVISPDKFYVRKQHLQEVYEKLTEDLEQEYSLASKVGTVYLPEKGMVCAVNLENCKNSVPETTWARGVVSELPGRGRVRLALPDSGHDVLVHWTALRYIRPNFTKLSALATECYLAGITPLNKKWNAAAVDLLQKYTENVLELRVEDNRNKASRNRGSLGVTLYDNTNDENVVCINNEMIKYKFAVSFGVYGFNQNPVEEQVRTNKSPLAKPKPLAPKTSQVTILKKPMPNKKVNEADLEAKDKGPLRLEVKILNYQSPSLIYVSLVHQQKTFNELFEKIQKFYSKNKGKSREEWKVGDKCGAFCLQSQTWRRAFIMELENDTAKVFYSDFACIETIPKSSLKELTSEFSSFGDAAIKCHLCGIMPAVGDEWPLITKEYLKELIDAYKRIFITKLGNFKDNSMPIQLWVYHTVHGGALEPNKSTWRCLNDKILEQGLCVPDQSQVAAATESNTEDNGDTLSFLNITGSVNEWLQLEPVPMVPLKTLKSDDETNESSPSPCPDGENNDSISTSGQPSNVLYISDWLPPEPLPCKEFTALPTYIDNDGVIYLHDVSQQDTLDLIRKALDVRFKNPDPKAKFNKWSVGEPCVALFFLDNRYYRGRIVEVNAENSTCTIHYIDYGNEEVCSFANLRKSVPLHQIPTQAHKCVLSRIRPIEQQWDRQTLDYIHKSIVEKQCFVKITGEAVNGVLPIELKYDKLCINDHLVDFEMAEYSDGTKPVEVRSAFVSKNKPKQTVKEEVIESDSGPDYIVVDDHDTITDQLSTSKESFDNSLKGIDWNKIIDTEESSPDENFITYPKDIEEEFMCNITVINDIKTLELNVIVDDDTTRAYEQMFEDLQAASMNMTPLNGIFENKACVAVFPEDGRWYRASILQFSEAKNRIKVRYVDYGNIEVISLADAKEILEEWVRLPPVSISAKLFGVQLNPDVDINDIKKQYAQIFLDQGPFHVKVMGYDESVPLVELRDDKNELVYKKLIEDKFFIMCE
uniref:RING finger protein 17 n=1 Tax=Heliothis virescens TaxID=7102 RepID=A0A2A4JVM1_HELVI